MTTDELLEKVGRLELYDILTHLHDGRCLSKSLQQKMKDLQIHLTKDHNRYDGDGLLVGFSVGLDLFAIQAWSSSYEGFEIAGRPFRAKEQTKQITITEWVKDE